MNRMLSSKNIYNFMAFIKVVPFATILLQTVKSNEKIHRSTFEDFI